MDNSIKEGFANKESLKELLSSLKAYAIVLTKNNDQTHIYI